MSKRDEPTEIELELLSQTNEAWLVREYDGAEEVWLPKSQVERGAPLRGQGDTYTFTLPAWLAEEKGFV